MEIGDALEEVVERRPAGDVLRSCRPAPALDAAIEAAGVTSLMAAPLVVKGGVAGVVEVGSPGARRFTREDESLLMLMADRAGLAIEHARAYERELSNVEMLQRSLLPERLPRGRGHPGRRPLHAGWRRRGRRLVRRDPARVRPRGRGDGRRGRPRHRGRGADGTAAPRDARLRARGPLAGRVLDRLDRVVRSLDGGQMATLLYLVLEPDHGTVRFASAGHVPPLVISPDRRGRLSRRARPTRRSESSTARATPR